MIDIHSHIIPGIDDGSKSMEMTLEMLKTAEQSGIKQVFATPHYLLEYGEAKIDEVKGHVAEINKILQEENIDIKVYSGQEVYFTENIVTDYIDGNIGTLNDSRYMLIEFDMRKFESSIFDHLYELQVKGITPIIAHVERYKYIMQTPELINRFIGEGYLFQLNSGSIEGKFGVEVQKTAKMLLKNGVYNFIGSDAHNISASRGMDLKGALSLIDIDNLKKFEESSQLLIDNKNIDFTGNLIKKKNFLFSIFKR
ncbi:tyrosine-protein phosphatase [Clostridium butyricum]|uniref:tyrosine-protein phosphatase n=1 Tax=Clostridium butyricum TaxID=1492 RepID=UPI00071E9EEC|nr:CpsB/CapC family capsule biosynthesis tyrosine phosphatase [Clostridium butyricum]ALS18159.1 capsular biosynthesis protein [Clostridium butyricum]MDM8132250.1 capsular biosynthesis protein [Clostridium butyricum]MDM8230713.1 capsular biosynthesis protein [Clostridium butyricum]